MKAKTARLSTHPTELPVGEYAHVDLAAATKSFEARFTVVHDHEFGPEPAFHAPTGQLYRDVMVGRHGKRFVTGDAAIDAWLRVVMNLPVSPKDELYWRIRPEINCFSHPKKGGWAIYSRFLISDKPRKS